MARTPVRRALIFHSISPMEEEGGWAAGGAGVLPPAAPDCRKGRLGSGRVPSSRAHFLSFSPLPSHHALLTLPSASSLLTRLSSFYLCAPLHALDIIGKNESVSLQRCLLNKTFPFCNFMFCRISSSRPADIQSEQTFSRRMNRTVIPCPVALWILMLFAHLQYLKPSPYEAIENPQRTRLADEGSGMAVSVG